MCMLTRDKNHAPPYALVHCDCDDEQCHVSNVQSLLQLVDIPRESKKQVTLLLSITLPNVARFQNSFTSGLRS